MGKLGQSDLTVFSQRCKIIPPSLRVIFHAIQTLGVEGHEMHDFLVEKVNNEIMALKTWAGPLKFQGNKPIYSLMIRKAQEIGLFDKDIYKKAKFFNLQWNFIRVSL